MIEWAVYLAKPVRLTSAQNAVLLRPPQTKAGILTQKNFHSDYAIFAENST